MAPRYRTPSTKEHAWTTIRMWKKGGLDMTIRSPPVPAEPISQKRKNVIRKTKRHGILEGKSILLENKLRDELEDLHNRIEITLSLRDKLEWQRIGVETVREQRAKPHTKPEYDEEVDKLERLIGQTWDEWKPTGGI